MRKEVLSIKEEGGRRKERERSKEKEVRSKNGVGRREGGRRDDQCQGRFVLPQI
jgi:hypothetical protein